MKIKRRDSSAIIDALSSGVVPPRGLQHILVGRKEEAQQIVTDLSNVREGASLVKFFIGDFGSGKSFIQGLVKQRALSDNFVVTNADFSTERRLYGEDKARYLYTELIKNLSTSSSPEGNALILIIDKWINQVQQEVMGNEGNGNSEVKTVKVDEKIQKEISKLDVLSGGYDFSRILSVYYRGFVEGNTDIQRKAIRWMRGEYGTKTEAKSELGVRDIINDHNYYDYLKIVSRFVKQVGYSGLVINFDEAINLYKINHPQAREKNYETILTMFNDCLQGYFEGLYITFGGTVDFLENERRGLYSYGALRRRLELNKYETTEHRDLAQPVIKLSPLGHEELLVLLFRLREIHALYYEYESTISDEELKRFIIKEFEVAGADKFNTVGHVIKHFMDALNILYQNSNYDRNAIFENITIDASIEESVTSNNIYNRFSST